MNLYLIRHAHAEEASPDSERRLSQKGRKQVRILAGFLARKEEFHPEEIWHSSLVRAKETALLLKKGMDLEAPLREIAGVTPGDNPQDTVRQLTHCNRAVALVGHEPHLSGLASLLVAGATEAARFAMKKGAVLALERAGNHWVVRWHVSPGLLE